MADQRLNKMKKKNEKKRYETKKLSLAQDAGVDQGHSTDSLKSQ